MAAAMNRQQQGQKRTSAAAGNAWVRYEALKRELTATTRTASEYDAACRRAAQLAGV